jgi:hypothetical protein
MKAINTDKYFKIASLASAVILLLCSAMLPLWAIIHPDIKGISAILFFAGLFITFICGLLVRIAYKEMKGIMPDYHPTDELESTGPEDTEPETN